MLWGPKVQKCAQKCINGLCRAGIYRVILEIHNTSLGTHLCEHGSFRHFAYQLRRALKCLTARACVGSTYNDIHAFYA